MQALRTYGRRTLVVTLYLIIGSLMLALLPLWLPVLWLLDRRHRTSYWRCVLFFGVFIWAGLYYLSKVLVFFWLKGGPFRDGGHAYLTRLWGAQRGWGQTLYRGARTIYRLKMTVDGAERAFADPGPLLLLSRHVSFGDTILPFELFKSRLPFQPRYVMKRELLWDPCIDIVGSRLPNAFVRRNSRDPAREVAEVQRLMEGVGPHDVVIIYPEGTRFTPRKRQEIIDRLREKGDTEGAARAEAYRHVLPPRPGGAIGLMEKQRTDVLFMAHIGLECIRTWRNMVDGSFVGTHLRVAFWRVSQASLPTGREALTAWLYERWSEVDDWVARQATEAPQ
jgi:1-acyl-sn-glycerol-3-phosphate acyltransferase